MVFSPNSKKHKELQDQINPIFNYFESISIGVRIGIYDRRIMCLSRKVITQKFRTINQAFIRDKFV
jgi:hypothetical protein